MRVWGYRNLFTDHKHSNWHEPAIQMEQGEVGKKKETTLILTSTAKRQIAERLKEIENRPGQPDESGGGVTDFACTGG